MNLKRAGAGLLLLGLVALAGVMGTGQAQNAAQTGSIKIKMEPAYTPDKNLSDDYRCFLLNPNLTADTYITGYQIHPEQEHLVHHVILFVANSSAVPQAEATDRGTEGPGWTCFGDSGVAGVSGLSGSLGVWAPGTSNTIFPVGTAKKLRAGSQLIMQVHYNLMGGEPKPDASSVELLTTTDSSLKLLNAHQVLSAVEIRCPGPYPADPESRCNRAYAVKQVKDPGVNESLHQLCGTSSGLYLSREIGAGDAQSVSCKNFVRRDGLAIGAFGHMHLRGKSLQVVLNPDSGSPRVILDIPKWNFNRQEQLWFEEPVALKVGDILEITCTYDNSGPIPGPDGRPLEPRYIIWGEGSTDEMCLALVNWIAP